MGLPHKHVTKTRQSRQKRQDEGETAQTADTIKDNETVIDRTHPVMSLWEQTSLMSHWWSVYSTDTLTAEQTASVGLNVMMTPYWRTHGRIAAVSQTTGLN